MHLLVIILDFTTQAKRVFSCFRYLTLTRYALIAEYISNSSLYEGSSLFKSTLWMPNSSIVSQMFSIGTPFSSMRIDERFLIIPLPKLTLVSNMISIRLIFIYRGRNLLEFTGSKLALCLKSRYYNPKWKR